MAAIALTRIGSLEPTRNKSAKLVLTARNRFFALVALLFLLLMSGCVAPQRTVLPAWAPPQLPTPRVAPLPLIVGVHYTEAFQREKHEDKYLDGRPWWYAHSPGEASIALFDSVLAASFERVVRVPTWPPASGARPDVALVIVPSISGVSTDYPSYLARTITYEIGIFTAEGERLDTWNVDARGMGTVFSSHETFSALALRDAATQLVIGLRERPKIKTGLLENDSPTIAVAAEDWARSRGMVVLPSAPRSAKWAACMEDALRGGPTPLVEVEQFRDAVFPWFEPSVDQPATPEAWAQRLKDPLVGAGAMEAGARYILFVDGSTTHSEHKGPFMCGAGAGGGGCLGVMSADRRTALNLTVVDSMRAEIAKEIEASESGSNTWIGIGVPIPIISMTETAACHKAAADVRELLKRRQSTRIDKEQTELTEGEKNANQAQPRS